MAITPQPGYIVDPTNPNAVIKDPSATIGPGGIPMVTPLAPPPPPTATSAVVPQTTPAQNIAAPASTPTQSPSTQTTTSPQAPVASPAVMPSNGSVVDLLNGLGQPSSYTDRAQLAQQFGIQNYQGTAAQNTELGKKYVDFYNSKKGTEAPAENPMRSQETLQTMQPQQQGPDPQQNFIDQYASMNPFVKQYYDQASQALSSQSTRQSFVDEYKQFEQEQGILADKLELVNIKNIMEGTEDDIRTEITKAGGFATEGQVQALTMARNKVFLKQANQLSQTIQAKEDYVDHIMQFTQMDREEVDKQVEMKLGLTAKMADMQDKLISSARENYQQIISKVGYDGLNTMLQGDARQTAQVEQLLGIAPGGLGRIASQPNLDQQIKQAQLQGLKQDLAIDPLIKKAQLAKMNQDLTQGPSVSTSIVDVGGKKYLINSKTGDIIKEYADTTGTGTFSTAQAKAVAQGNISQVKSILDNPALRAAVGPTSLARGTLPFTNIPYGTSGISGAKSNVIADIEQLRQSLTLTALQNAKANGATFGALSDSELQLLSQSSSKLGTWAKKDSGGNVTGYSANEVDFKKELDKINYYAKLDYLLKGGDPSEVGVIETPDGRYWSQNSDGSKSLLQ